MARGRMIANQTASDKKFNQFSSDTCRVAWLLAVTFADCEGRIQGDPGVVRSMTFPRREDVTIEMVKGFITEWADAEMVIWYEAEDDLWIQFVNFEKHNPGLRKDREPASNIPPFNPDTCRKIAGEHPEEIPVKLREVKLREEKLSEINGMGCAPALQDTPLNVDDDTSVDQSLLTPLDGGKTGQEVFEAATEYIRAEIGKQKYDYELAGRFWPVGVKDHVMTIEGEQLVIAWLKDRATKLIERFIPGVAPGLTLEFIETDANTL